MPVINSDVRTNYRVNINILSCVAYPDEIGDSHLVDLYLKASELGRFLDAPTSTIEAEIGTLPLTDLECRLLRYYWQPKVLRNDAVRDIMEVYINVCALQPNLAVQTDSHTFTPRVLMDLLLRQRGGWFSIELHEVESQD